MDGSEQILMVLMPLLQKVVGDVNPGRFAENLVILWIAWWQVRAGMKGHLTKVEDALNKLSDSVQKGFAAGEQRFSKLEIRVDKIETNQKP
jgi:hypothetical protein